MRNAQRAARATAVLKPEEPAEVEVDEQDGNDEQTKPSEDDAV